MEICCGDNQGDVLLTKRALKSGKVLHNVHVANDGEAALAFLPMSNTGRLRAQNLILLDLNLPKVARSRGTRKDQIQRSACEHPGRRIDQLPKLTRIS